MKSLKQQLVMFAVTLQQSIYTTEASLVIVVEHSSGGR